MKTIEVEAESLDDARRQLKEQIPVDMVIIREQVISHGTPQSLEVEGNTIDEALQVAKTKLPVNTTIEKHVVSVEPEREVLKVLAYDEQTARRQLDVSPPKRVESLVLERPGRKGLFGLGRQPHLFNAVVVRPAVVKIFYTPKVKVCVTVGTLAERREAKAELIRNAGDLYRLVVEERDWETFARVAHRSTSLFYWGGSHGRLLEALRDGGDVVVNLLLDELRSVDNRGRATEIANVLADIGNPLAAPELKRRLDGGDFAAYGEQTVRDFLAAHRTEAEISADAQKAATEKELFDRLRAEFRGSDDDKMLHNLRQLCAAYAEDDGDEINRLEPVATVIGEELNHRGGMAEMRRVYDQLGNIRGARTLDMHWGGIGQWRG